MLQYIFKHNCQRLIDGNNRMISTDICKIRVSIVEIEIEIISNNSDFIVTNIKFISIAMYSYTYTLL